VRNAFSRLLFAALRRRNGCFKKGTFFNQSRKQTNLPINNFRAELPPDVYGKDVKRNIPAILLIALLVCFSLLAPKLQGLLPGFSPLPAVFFCVAACMGLRWMWLPTVAWFLSYLLSNQEQGIIWDLHLVVIIAGFGLTAWVGMAVRGKGWVVLLGGSAGSAIAFYLSTNTGAWIILPDYPKTWSGFLQSQTTGLPGYLPAWAFLRGSLVASLVFTGLFILGQNQWGTSRAKLTHGAAPSSGRP